MSEHADAKLAAAGLVPSRVASEAAALYVLTDRLYRARSLNDVFDAALDAIVGTLGCERASILLFDDTGVMRFVDWRGLSNRYRTTLEGHTPWKPGQRDPEPIFVTDIDQTAESDRIKSTLKAERIRALGFIPLTAEGGVIGKFMTYYEERRRFTDDEINLAITIARQVGFSLERARSESARRKAVESLRESEERFRLMSEQAPVMIWLSDENGRCLHLNKMLRDFWGVDENAIGDFDWSTTMHPEDAANIARQMQQATMDRKAVSVTGRYRRADGSYRVLETYAQPRLAADGDFLGMVGVNTDATDRTEAEAHRELLLAELSHRVKNTLAVVQGIAHQTFRGTSSMDDSRLAFDGRLIALARGHDLLIAANWEAASLHQIAADALQAQEIYAGRITFSGPAILLRPKQTLALGMAFHELFTNAVKYGALSNDHGRIELTWSLDAGQKRLLILWREINGPAVSEPSKRGFGSILLEKILHRDIDGEVSIKFPASGVVCSIAMSISD